MSNRLRTLTALLTVALAATVTVAGAQQDAPYFVKDIWPGTQPGVLISNIARQMQGAGGVVYFSGNEPISGSELYRTDGTAAGTTLVKDINPGPAGSSVTHLTDVGGTLFFVATNETHGCELWKSDGTNAGTVLVRDINPGRGPSDPSELTVVNEKLFFFASDGFKDGLWTSDGTAAGTIKVRDFGAVPRGVRLYERSAVAFSGLLFFAAADDVTTHGVELWKSDGTAEGTVMLTEINPGFHDASPGRFMPFRGELFFAARDSQLDNVELWKTDGTASGTVRVKDIFAGPDSSHPTFLTVVGGTLFFTATTDPNQTNPFELWKSDGTEAGTQKVVDRLDVYGNLANVGGVLLFSASSTEVPLGWELWRSDGTSAGTFMVKDINPSGNSLNLQLSRFRAVGSTLYFAATDGITPTTVWRSDGTANGTVKLGGNRRPHPNELIYADSRLYFSGADKAHGHELWAMDLPFPAAPAVRNATATRKTITLNWNDRSRNEAGFEIDRFIGNRASIDPNVDADFQPLASLPRNTTSYLVKGLVPGRRYTYRIRAFNDNGNSEYRLWEKVQTRP